MVKKIICLGVVLVMVLSLAACNAGKELSEYKESAKAEIESYAKERQDNYSTENWIIVSGIVMACKVTVDEAENKSAVDIAVNDAKEAIDEVDTKEDEIEKKIEFEKVDFNGMVHRNGSANFFSIIRSKDELTAFFEEVEIDAWAPWRPVTPLWEIYEAEFFESKALVFYFYTESDSSVERYVDSVYIKGKTLTIKIIQNGVPINLNLAYCQFIIEVNKSDISKAKDIVHVFQCVEN